MSSLPVLVLSGSARTGSLNRRLADVAVRLLEAQGAHPTVVDLRALDLPLYDADTEARGLPPGARRLADSFADHSALLLASPEYNGFPTPLLINALDWVSRVPEQGRAPAGMKAMAGTVAGLLSASPGALGGMRSLMFIRQFLQMNLGMLVVPEQFGLGQAGGAFAADGGLVDPKAHDSVARVVGSVVRVATALQRAPG